MKPLNDVAGLLRCAGGLFLLAGLVACTHPANTPERPSSTVPAAAPAPMQRVHSHNDYQKAQPLSDAVTRGAGSVEVDVFLIDDDLMVAHSRAEVAAGKSLRSLYLEPLQAFWAARSGRIYPGAKPLILLVDLKADGLAAYRELERQLRPYRPMLTRWVEDREIPGAVTVLLSGDRPVAALAVQSERWASLDGRLEDLDKNPPAGLVPLVSANWTTVFKWNGRGEMPAEDKGVLRSLVQRAHAQKRQLRFWNAPDVAAVWAEQLTAGVDLINTDNVADLQSFLEKSPARGP